MRHVHPKRMSKEKNQRYHAKVRMLQHYGKQITNYDLQRMAEIYRHSPDTVILTKQSHRVRKALIWYQGEVYPIIYDKVRKQIVTVLKVEYLTDAQLVIYENFKSRMILQQSEIKNTVLPTDVKVNVVEEEKESVETTPPEQVYFEDGLSEEENQRLMKEAFDRLNF